MRLLNLIAGLALVATPASALWAKDEALAKAVAAPTRTPALVERDIYRHPQAELEFFGIKPTMTVVEIAPGGGYWTEILGPYLHDQGTYYTAITPRAAGESAARSYERWKQKLEATPAYTKIKISELGAGIFNPAPAGSADMVLTFRNLHNWMSAGITDEVFASFFKALKPGGVLGIEEHRASNDKPQDPKASTGYVREDYAIQLAEKAGFKYLGKSDILTNPKDTKDWAKGVWTLPPTFALGDQDREKYLAIGEADNFLLKFEKPKQ